MRRNIAHWLLAVLDSPYFIDACFAVFIGVRISIVLFIPIEPHSDELWYYNRALGIAAGHGYSESGVPTAYWPVGWPGLLGIVFRLLYPTVLTGQVINVLCAAATFFLTLRLGTTLFADRRVGRLSALLLTIYPNYIAYVPTLAVEVFYTAILLLAIEILVSGNGYWRLVSAGIVFGFAALTKAQTLLLPAALFAVWWVISRPPLPFFPTIGRAAVVYAAMAAVILPWTARNYHVFGDIVLISTNGGPTLLAGNNPTANGDDAENDPLVKRLPHDVTHQVASDRLATSLAVHWIRNHRLAFAVLIPRKIWRLWAPDGEAEWCYQLGYRGYSQYWPIFRAVRAINQVYYSGSMAFFLLSILICCWDRQWPSIEFCTGYALILFTTAISIIFSGQSRFHFPMMPWVAMYASWSVLRLTVASRLTPAPASA